VLVYRLEHRPHQAAIARERDWKLSPAYDLTPVTPVSEERRELAMSCGDFGRWANAGNFLSQCQRFLLSPEEAQALIAQMQKTVRKRWSKILRGQGVTGKDTGLLRGAFDYPRFSLPPV